MAADSWLKNHTDFEYTGVWRPAEGTSKATIEVRLVAPDLSKVTEEQQVMLDHFTQLFDKGVVAPWLNAHKDAPADDISLQVLELMKARILKVHLLNQDESFADQMKVINHMKSQNMSHVKKRLAEQVSKMLLRGQRPWTFEGVQLAVKQALVAQPDDLYEF